MRICYIADVQSIHTRRWAKYFAEKGDEVHVITFSPTDEPINGVYVHCVDPHKYVRKNLAYSLLIFKLEQIKELVRKIKPDVLHGHFLTDHGFSAAWSRYRPLIVSSWGSDVLIDPRRSVLRRWLLKYTLRKADMITATSDYLTNQTRRYAPANSQILTIPFGVDTRQFYPRSREKSDFVSLGVVKHGLDEPGAGVHFLLFALPAILKEIPHTKLLLFGRENGQSLSDLVRRLGLENAVEFKGFVPHDSMCQHLGEIDILVVPSLWESFCVAALEAQAMKIPVVATRVGGLLETVKDGVTGILVNPGSSNELANSIIAIAKDRDLMEKMGKNGREFVSAKYEWITCGEMMERTYELVASLGY